MFLANAVETGCLYSPTFREAVFSEIDCFQVGSLAALSSTFSHRLRCRCSYSSSRGVGVASGGAAAALERVYEDLRQAKHEGYQPKKREIYGLMS